ncbi:MAG TPA: alginate lyase family protein [Cyclobacteriaceae bacterium]|jgi:uncharacterized heparinase superfamily protein|nr:alginate lyase family protein [Cyclobacteriaceae bacterium]
MPELAFAPTPRQLTLVKSIPSAQCYQKNKFVFLNNEMLFGSHIDWNCNAFGKLWTYNLNYFDFLHQEKMEINEAVNLIDDYCNNAAILKDGVEPYPISVRLINWIKFFALNNINNPRYNAVLYSHCSHLASNLEYHLLGNHLLENGYALFFASYYFSESDFYKKAKKILRSELVEQVKKDGAHFELSPMYHQILLARLLDCINLAKSNNSNEELLPLLQSTAMKMIGWLKAVTFQNGDIPMVNDAISGIAPSSREIFSYASRLGVDADSSRLSDSGYRMIRVRRMEMFLDIGNIGPDYIPGHAHSDTFNFILYVDNRPLLVEAGTSTYAVGTQRIIERSTASHNTVIVNEKNQSEVWSSFRVGKRATIIRTEENDHKIRASHDGYASLNVVHERSWGWLEDEFEIVDEIIGGRDVSAVAYIHFPPGLTPKIEGVTVHVGPVVITFKGQQHILLEQYDYATAYNKLNKGDVLKVSFKRGLETRIKLVR